MRAALKLLFILKCRMSAHKLKDSYIDLRLEGGHKIVWEIQLFNNISPPKSCHWSILFLIAEEQISIYLHWLKDTCRRLLSSSNCLGSLEPVFSKILFWCKANFKSKDTDNCLPANHPQWKEIKSFHLNTQWLKITSLSYQTHENIKCIKTSKLFSIF